MAAETQGAVSVADLQNAQQRGIVKGVVNFLPGSKTPLNYPRKEIDQFICDEHVANLFLLALVELQNNDGVCESDGQTNVPFSWYGMCSIHGRPYKIWRGIDQATVKAAKQYPDNIEPPQTLNAGYCSHSSVLFPTWHRPYVSMMEQTICLKMHFLAREYPEPYRKEYIDAAYRFRMPYLDPFVARVLCEPTAKLSIFRSATWQCGAPQILSSKVVTVRMPKDPNFPLLIDNPLYSYEFPQQASGQPLFNFDYNPPFAFKYLYPRETHEGEPPPGFVLPNQKTVRSPDPQSGASDHSRLEKAWPELRTAGENLYAMLVEDQSYEHFSNTQYWATATNRARHDARAADLISITRSIESFHDAVHAYFGFRIPDPDNSIGVPQGHMFSAEQSCYDPVFWLHHCNIDRLFAIWLSRNPAKTTFSQPLYSPLGYTYTEPLGYQQTQGSPLVPFLKANTGPGVLKQFWTSTDCYDTTVLGYSYAEQHMTPKDLNAWINTSFLWLKTRNGRPSARSETGFPVDFGPLRRNAPCLPPVVFVDSGSAWPHPYIRDPAGGLVRAVQSISPQVSGVDARLRRTVNAPGADSTDLVDASAFAAFVNTNSIREWEVFTRYEKFAAGGSFSVHFYLGRLRTGPDWRLQNNYIGEIFNFATKAGSGCQNCTNQIEAGLMAASVLSMTVKLQQYLAAPGSLMPFTLKTLDRRDVIPFLTKHLNWIIIDFNGKVIQPNNIDGFKVMVVTRVFHPPPAKDELGSWEAYEQAVEITHGKPGGLSQGESF